MKTIPDYPIKENGLIQMISVGMSHMSRVMRKPAFCICENKGADQPSSNRATDQHLCFRYTASTIPLLP